MKSIEFRTDIEGLRTLAILPILIFHLNPLYLPGGFVGVDIFFVISGFLISGQILKAEPGKFRYRDFYVRRIRRLFPALAMTVGISMLLGWRLLTPQDYVALAWSGLASLVGVANIHFYLSVDYFNENALLHPLLHVWSLSVEEQFYLVWPAILITAMGLAKRRAAGATAVILVMAVSFAASYVTIQKDPHLTFYMMPFRIFEFAIGALALLFINKLAPGGRAAAFAGLAGMAMLVASLFGLDSSTPWPGSAALLPCVGTALLLVGGRHPFWQAALSFPMLRFIGRISYSIYLVHWPLIVFYRAWTLVPPTIPEQVAQFAASIVLGWLLFTFVEQVYRVSPAPRISGLFAWNASIQHLASRAEILLARHSRTLFQAFLLVPAVIACFGVTIILTHGFPHRVQKGLVQQGAELSFAGDLCASNRARCAFGDLGSSRVVYLVGDSHALNLVYGLDGLFKEHGIRGIAFYDHGCLFLKGTMRFINGVADRACARNVAQAYDQLGRDRHPVILVGNYHGYVKQIGDVSDGALFQGVDEDYLNWVAARFSSSLRFIGANERPTVIFNSSYVTGIDTAKCFAIKNDVAACKPHSLAESRLQNAPADRMIEQLRGSFPAVTILDPKAVFCSDTECQIQNGGTVYFRDASHLTKEGSAFLINKLAPTILTALDQTRRT